MPNPFYTKIFNAAPFSVARSSAVNQEFASLQTAFDTVDALKANLASPTFTGVATLALGSAALPSIAATGGANTGIWFPAVNTWAVSTSGTERARLTSAGRWLVNTSTELVSRFGGTSYTPRVQQASTTGSDGTSLIAVYANTAGSIPSLALARSRAATIGAHAALLAADQIGSISWAGSDGTQFTEAAKIRVDTPSNVLTDQIFGRMVFMLSNGGTTPATVMTMNPGSVDVAGSLSANSLLANESTVVSGYTAGAGGNFTQTTSLSTAVTVTGGRPTWRVVTFSGDSHPDGATTSFTVNNSLITADTIVLAQFVNGGTRSFRVDVFQSAVGSCLVSITNTTGFSIGGGATIKFALINTSSS